GDAGAGGAVDIDDREREGHRHVGHPRLVVDRVAIDGAGPRNRPECHRLAPALRAHQLRRVNRMVAIGAEGDRQPAFGAAGPEGSVFGREFGKWSHRISCKTGVQIWRVAPPLTRSVSPVTKLAPGDTSHSIASTM